MGESRRVVGPPSCERHRAHVVGCLNCAAEVAASDDYTLDDFLGHMEHIGWDPVGDEFKEARPHG